MAKMAVSKGRLRVSKSRKGRRSMSVTTYLRKEKEGTLYKESADFRDTLDEHSEDIDINKLRGLSRRRLPGTLTAEARSGLEDLKNLAFGKKADVSEQIVAEHQERLEKSSSYEEKMPWYTTAGLGTAGAMVGKKLLKKAPGVGAVIGALAGTGMGLEGGTALGKKLDQRKSAEAKGKPGDSPTASSASHSVATEMYPWNQSLEGAKKVAEIGNLVSRKNEFPTSDAAVSQDPVSRYSRSRQGTRWAGATQPVPGYNPNVDDKQVAKTAESDEVYTLSVDELEKFASLYMEAIRGFDSEKLASADLEELHKEAIMGALRKLIPKSKKIINVGGETVDLRPKSSFSYKAIGKKLEDTGNMFRAPKGVSPEMARAAGNTRAGSAGGRILGEGLHSAGHHMGHASTVGKAMNPIGKPVGGFIEGITAQSGRELQRAGGAVSTGLKSGGTLGGGLRGATGRGMERHAAKAGIVGEIATGAGTATALGHAVSPAAQGLASIAKATGTYAPMKGTLGSLGFNVAKDVAATGAEMGLQSGRLASGAKGVTSALGRIAPNVFKVGRSVAGA